MGRKGLGFSVEKVEERFFWLYYHFCAAYNKYIMNVTHQYHITANSNSSPDERGEDPTLIFLSSSTSPQI